MEIQKQNDITLKSIHDFEKTCINYDKLFKIFDISITI